MRRGHPLLRLVLVPALGLLGAVVGWFADGDPVAAAVLLVEPALWVVVLWVAYFAILRRQGTVAFGVLCGGVAAAACARIPRPPAEEAGVDAAPFTERTRSCARELALPQSGVRILHWTVDASPPSLAERVADLHPDVVVLRGVVTEAALPALEAAVGGESVLLAGPAPTYVFTRGVVDLCGKSDRWTDAPADGVALGLVFLSVDEGTRFPLVAAQLPGVWAVPEWRRAVRSGRAALRSTADALASSLLITAVEAPYALGAPRLSATLRAAQLLPVGQELDWPRWPFGLHNFAPVWAGQAWAPGRAELVSASGVGRSGTLVELLPRWGATSSR